MAHDEQPGDDALARSRRIDGLRKLSQQGQDSLRIAQTADATSAGLTPSSKRAFSLRWWVLTALIVIALIVAGSAAYLALRPQPKRAHKPPVEPIVIQPAADGMRCWTYVTWSPTSTQIALFGHRQSCSGAPLLNIYDARTGKLATQLDPASLLAQVLPQPSAATPAYVSDIAWSPDGQRLALVFGAHTTAQTWIGVLLTDAAGQHAEVVTQEFSQEVAPILQGVADLTQHTVTAAPAPPPALSYRWGARGALDLETPLTASTPPAQGTPGPIGSPSGKSFTVWQPGWVEYETTDPTTGQTYDPGVYTWYSTFLAWSPDGRYLRQLSLGGRLAPAGGKPPSAATLKALHQEQAPTLPVRDSGLQHVLAIVTQNAQNAQSRSGARQAVAWRPDGNYVAAQMVVTNLGGDDSATAHQVAVYDCATGGIWGILHPETGTPSGGPPVNLLRWSPDGAHLLVADSDLGAVTIWGPELLPR